MSVENNPFPELDAPPPAIWAALRDSQKVRQRRDRGDAEAKAPELFMALSGWPRVFPGL